MIFEALKIKVIAGSVSLLTASAKWLAAYGAKAVTGPIKDLSGVANDIASITRAKLDIQLLEYNLAEKRSRIVKPSPEEIDKYGKPFVIIVFSLFLAGSIAAASRAQARASPADLAILQVMALTLCAISVLITATRKGE
ncbi:hypothetical protein [Granulicella aggregans]|uniref:hypothetical protein n=1 Tax=Granulicella aggregans TaxID=474949 RepID=UPI0021E0D45F|nr:hypothetical protein [Granulicella aggregans]